MIAVSSFIQQTFVSSSLFAIMQKGELVHIMQHDDNGWCFGVATDRYGFFPTYIVSYFKVYTIICMCTL